MLSRTILEFGRICSRHLMVFAPDTTEGILNVHSLTSLVHLRCALWWGTKWVVRRRPGLKNTGGALYIRAAMQFMRLPLKTDPMEALKSSVELTDVICKVPGMMRFGPV